MRWLGFRVVVVGVAAASFGLWFRTDLVVVIGSAARVLWCSGWNRWCLVVVKGRGTEEEEEAVGSSCAVVVGRRRWPAAPPVMFT
ncbi:hypothetical protein Hanom_Chr01g00052041 [Helianthus anomalus]